MRRSIARKGRLSERIGRVKQRLKDERVPSALILSSAPQRTLSRDQNFAFRQDSDFFYLTGSQSPGLSLLVSTETQHPFLFVPVTTKHQILWEGAPPNYQELAQEIGAELIVSKDRLRDLLEKLKGISKLYFQNVPDSLAWKVALHLMELPSHRRGALPKAFEHSDSILAEMRLYKDAHEIELITKAARITAESIQKAAPLIRPGISESEVAAALEYGFRSSDGEVAFPTIVAGGKNAAVLHHRAGASRLEENQMLLIDCGATLQGYAADISRVFPISGVLDQKQAEIYDIVLSASRAAIRRMKDGVRLRAVQDTAVRVLTEGLKELGVLRGKTSNLIKRDAYKPYFPHSIGHSLGLDVHDIVPYSHAAKAKSDFILKRGMVFTVEPGLYFAKPVRSIKPSGYRIEDDVLVTLREPVVLSSESPTAIAEVESLLR